MNKRIERSGLQIATPIYDLITAKICPGTAIDPDMFWSKFADIIRKYAPINRDLLEKRKKLQSQIDAWHVEHLGNFDFSTYKIFCNRSVIWSLKALISPLAQTMLMWRSAVRLGRS